MTGPEVSVIIVTYNQADSIGRSIESVLSQQCDFIFEIIIGEDGSTDNTREVCEDYARRFPEIVRMMPKAPNKGVVDNYFDCLEAAKGKFVTDCAGDDTYHDRHRLQRQRDFLVERPGTVCVMSDWIIRSATGDSHSGKMDRYEEFHQDVSGQRMLELILGSRGNIPLLSAMMFRREVVADILERKPGMIRRKEWNCEDVPLLATLAAKGSSGYLPLTAPVYNVGSESVSNTGNYGKLFDFYCGVADCVNTLSKEYEVDVTGKEFRRSLSERLSYLAWLLWKSPTDERRAKMKRLIGNWVTPVGMKVRVRLAMLRN